MYKNILLPVDGSERSERAAKECIALVKSTGAKVALIHVIPHFHLHYQPWATPKSVHNKIEKEHEEDAKQFAQEMVAKMTKRVKSEGIDCEGLVVVGDHPYEEIIRNAEKRKCDLIIMASHGHKGLNAVLLGSETVKVLTHSKLPVLVVR
jgi:nucleotide-binding universal stress UspA family protein